MSESQYRFHRLPEFDYSTPGAYFITVCTNGKRNYFWESPFKALKLDSI